MAKSPKKAPTGAKKKTTRKKQAPELPSLVERTRMLSSFMRGTLAEQAKKTGQSHIYVGGEAACMMLGIPLPSFVLEYLVGLNILPFGIFLMLVGQEGIGKSGLAFEIGRWFRRLSAAQILYMENESKYSASWAASIFGYDDPEPMKIVQCESMNDWQKIAQDDFDRFKKFCLGTASKPGPGKIFGYLQILDTLMGKATTESIERIEKAGFAGRAFADEARSITQLLRAHPQRFAHWPAMFLVINQVKPKKDMTGVTIREMAGGQGVKFQVSYQWELRRAGASFRRRDWSISKLQLQSYKNAMAEDYVHRQIPINVCVRVRPIFNPMSGETEPLQETVWDWNGATTDLICNLLEDKVRGVQKLRAADKERLRELTPIRQVTGGRVYCETLGVPKDHPVERHVLGRLIQQTPAVLKGLRELFGIQVWPSFDMNTTFDQQVAKARKAIAARLEKVCPSHVMTERFDRTLDDPAEGEVTDDIPIEEGADGPDPEIENPPDPEG